LPPRPRPLHAFSRIPSKGDEVVHFLVDQDICPSILARQSMTSERTVDRRQSDAHDSGWQAQVGLCRYGSPHASHPVEHAGKCCVKSNRRRTAYRCRRSRRRAMWRAGGERRRLVEMAVSARRTPDRIWNMCPEERPPPRVTTPDMTFVDCIDSHLLLMYKRYRER